MAMNEGKGNKGRRVGVGDKRKYGGGGKKKRGNDPAY